MRKIMLCLLCFLAVLGLRAQQPQEMQSKISAATVYLQGAQVSRTGYIPIKTGKNEVILKGLANGIDPQSIQVSAPPEVVITAVTHQVNYLSDLPKSPFILQLEDSLQMLKAQKEEVEIELVVIGKEKDMILKNQQLAGKETGLSIETLRKTAAFFRKRLGELSKAHISKARQEKEIEENINRIQKQLNYKYNERNQTSNDVSIIIEAFRPSSRVELKVSYLIREAGWTPRYNIRAKEVGQPVQLEYLAEIWQNSGIDWNQVPLTLSTANPSKGGQKPFLSPWYLYVLQMDRDVRYKSREQPGADFNGLYGSGGRAADSLVDGKLSVAQYTTIREGAVMTSFDIEIPQNIPSDGKRHQSPIREYKLKAGYQHLAIPKLDPDAFLLAQLTGWDTLNLLPGKANIFFEGSFISTSTLNPNYTEDTLAVSLGRDPGVVITREQNKDFTNTKRFGGNEIRTYSYEINIRNTKNQAINLKLRDQLPVSQDKSIQVKLEENGEGKWNEETGELEWEVSLAPAESKTLKFSYTVKYPKDKIVNGL